MKASLKSAIVLALYLLAAAIAVNAVAADKADYVFKNGAIYTIDSKNPTAQAIAITGKHIPTSEPTTACRRSSATRHRSSISRVRCCCRDSLNRTSTRRWRW